MATPQDVARSELVGLMVCPTCNASFNSSTTLPMQLYCGHTICLPCLERLPKDADGHVACPVDRQVDIRDFEDISESHHLIDTFEKIEVCCINNFNDVAEVYTQEGYTYCQKCAAALPRQQFYPVRSVDLGGYFAQLINSVMSNPQTRAQAITANPNAEKRIKLMASLAPKARQALYYSLMGRPIPTLPKPREVVSKVDENGWVILKRFHNIIPEKYCTNFDQVKRWTLTQNSNQVEAVTIRPSATIRVRAVLLCKECGTFAGSIQAVFLVEGAETHNSTVTQVAQNVRFTARNKQTEKVVFSRPYEMRAARDYTIKVKYVGQALYFGDPSRRVDSLAGPDGVTFRVSDPKFTNGEYQNGQGALAGPIVGLLYEPTRPIA